MKRVYAECMQLPVSATAIHHLMASKPQNVACLTVSSGIILLKRPVSFSDASCSVKNGTMLANILLQFELFKNNSVAEFS